MTIKAIIFDVDGTLVHHAEDKTVWEVLNQRFTGSDDQNILRFDLYKRGELSYAEWVALDIGAWRDAGATREAITGSFGTLNLVEGARETLDALKARGAVRLHSVYLDTPALTLARNGVACRLRRCGRRRPARSGARYSRSPSA